MKDRLVYESTKYNFLCWCEPIEGEAEIGQKMGVARQGSIVRSLTMEEQIETLIDVYD